MMWPSISTIRLTSWRFGFFHSTITLALILLMLGYTLAITVCFMQSDNQLCRLNKPLLAAAFSGSRTESNNEKEDLWWNLENQNKNRYQGKKPRVYYKVNPHKKVVIALWVPQGSFSFAIFKHLTAIDTHTIHRNNYHRKGIRWYSSCRKFCENFCESLLFMGAIH